MIDIVVMVVVFFIFIAIIYKKYNYFACSSMKSEAKFALQQIYSAQMLYFNEFGKFLCKQEKIIRRQGGDGVDF